MASIDKIIKDGEEYDIATAAQTYKVAEQVIGTWIDGKPLYRRIIQCNLPNNNSWTNIVSADYVDTLKAIYGYFVANDYRKMNIPHAEDAVYVSPSIMDGYIQLKCTNNLWYGRPATLILEYTKTTD